MTAPAVLARGTPVGFKLPEGFVSKVTFAANPTVSIWEKSVKPTGLKVEMIDQTTMFNTKYATKYPAALLESTGGSLKGAYDPKLRSQILALVGVPTTITQTWPDGSTEAAYGCLAEVDFDELKPKSQPEANFKFEITNYDATNKVEEGPVYTDDALAGT